MTPSTCYILGDLVTDCPPISPHTWQPALEVTGEYWEYHAYDGPRPTTWYESPMTYQLVKAGTLPPLEDRVPPPEDRGIIQGPSGIGYYGGVYRYTATFLYFGETTRGTFAIRDSNGLDWYPYVGKSWNISEDGRVYTMTMRKDHRWSDGSPLSMEDVRFAWEDANFNKELNPSIPVEFRDPVTDNTVKFATVDDVTWTLTFDTPVFNLFELRSSPSSWCAKGSFSYYCPEFMKQFHPKYADPVALKKALADANMDDWTQLFTQKSNLLGDLGTDRPCLSGHCPLIKKDTELTFLRNMYFPWFDPEGNQLPYLDRQTMFNMGNREAAVFRSMNGENDGQTSFFLVPEVPLYNANMDKGDYSIYHWPSTGGSDLVLQFNMVYNEDPEIGKWIRTKDFRKALSLGMDREQLNETLFLGIGTIQNWAPHPSTPYYPGRTVAQHNVQYDPDAANDILDRLGLTAKDSEGFRLRTDNGERLVLNAVVPPRAADLPILELTVPMWAEIGIKLDYRLIESAPTDYRAGTEYLMQRTDFGAYQANPWCCEWTQIAPMTRSNSAAPDIGLYIESKGEKGMGKDANPAYLPLAPAGNYPADVSGNLNKLVEMWQEGRAYPGYHPERVRIAKEMFTIYGDELYALPVAGFTGIFRGIFLNRNNMRNQPVTHIRDHNGFHTWAYYFDGGTPESRGMDNLHHTENRSTFKSFSFIGGG
jgi:peptide/nickel transport system substrate-binding protein